MNQELDELTFILKNLEMLENKYTNLQHDSNPDLYKVLTKLTEIHCRINPDLVFYNEVSKALLNTNVNKPNSYYQDLYNHGINAQKSEIIKTHNMYQYFLEITNNKIRDPRLESVILNVNKNQ